MAEVRLGAKKRLLPTPKLTWRSPNMSEAIEEDGERAMDSEKLSDWVQIITGFAIVLGLGLVIWELQQSREATMAQLTNEGFAQVGQQNATVMGGDIYLTTEPG